LLASTLTAGFLIAGVSAWQLLKGTATPGTHLALRTAVSAVAVAVPLQIFMGDLHGLHTLEHQPAKIAAIEGIWQTEKGAPLTLFGLPNEKKGRTDYALQIPKAASLILAHDMDAELKGLNEFAGAHPPVAPVFWSFRVMVGMGLLMLAVAWVAAWALWRRRSQRVLALPRPLMWTLVGMTFSGWVATLAGWYVTEMGRQPYLVYGLFNTADAVAPHGSGMVAGTLAAYLTVYVLLLFAYVGVIKYMAEHAAQPVPDAAPPTAHTV
jgi:cytochrome d ubiquinol oxidase subunit I